MTATPRPLEYGSVQEVNEELAGDELAADAPAGALQLQLYDAVDFNEDGGTLLLESDDGTELVTYSSADLDADLVALATPLAAAWAEGTTIRPEPPGVERRALVMLDLDGEAIDARIPHALFDRLDLGTRAELHERVSLYLDDSEWVVEDVLGQEPVVDGSYISPETLPSSAPTEPPESSPAVTVDGVANGLILRAEEVEPGTLIAYHLTDSPPTDAEGEPLPFTPTVDTMIGEPTRATILVVTELPADGTPLEPETAYYVRAVASNAVGEAAPGPMSSGALDLENVSELIASEVSAGFLLAGSIRVGQITIHPDTGITIPTASGGIVLPADETEEASFSGTITTGSILVKDHLTINGKQNSINGELVLANVVDAPQEGPQLGWQWPWWATLPTQTWSLTDDGGANWVTFEWLTGDFSVHAKGSGALVASYEAPSGYNVEAITRVGAYYFVAAFKAADADALYVLKLNSSFALVGEVRIVHRDAVPKIPTIGVNEAGLPIVAFARSAGVDVRVYPVDPDALVRLDGLLLDYSSIMGGTPQDLQGITRQLGPDGITLEWTVAASYLIYRHADGVAATSAHSLERPESVKGIHWDGERIWTYGASSFRVWKWGTERWETEPSVQFTWYDDDPLGTGVHETPPSPPTAFRPPAHAHLRVVEPTPADTGDPDSPNTARIYINGQLQTGRLAWTGGYLIYETPELSGIAPPTTNSFVNASPTPGALTSAGTDGSGDPIIELNGDGSGRVGPYEWDAAGVSASFDDVEARLTFLETPGPWRKVGTTGNPGYVNGFSAWGSDGTKFRVNQAGDMLTITGDVSVPGNVSNGDVIFTLPSGFRPSIDVNNMFGWQNSSGVKFCLINVGANGQVTWWTGGNTPGGRSIFTVHVPLGA